MVSGFSFFGGGLIEAFGDGRFRDLGSNGLGARI